MHQVQSMGDTFLKHRIQQLCTALPISKRIEKMEIAAKMISGASSRWWIFNLHRSKAPFQATKR